MQDFEMKPNEAQSAVEGSPHDIPGFTRASDSPSDPVGHIDGDWGFWDECWCDWNGGHADEAAARNALADYVANVLEGAVDVLKD